MRASVHRLGMAHPGDLSQLAALFDAGTLDPRHVCAVIGKTEGNGGVNDFTRGYFTLAFSALLAERSGRPRAEIVDSVPCVISGGTEGVLSPHYLVFAREAVAAAPVAGQMRPAIGGAFSPGLPPEKGGPPRWTGGG